MKLSRADALTKSVNPPLAQRTSRTICEGPAAVSEGEVAARLRCELRVAYAGELSEGATCPWRLNHR